MQVNCDFGCFDYYVNNWYANMAVNYFPQIKLLSNLFSKNKGVARSLNSFHKTTISQTCLPKTKSFAPLEPL
jgi:hypothetical protein